MLSLLASILGIIPGLTGLATTIATKAFDAKVKMFQAKTGADRDVAVATIRKAAIDSHEGTERLKVIAGSRVLLAIVVGFATPFIIFEWKVVVVDIVLGWGSTDPIKGQVADWATTIIGGVFGSTSALALGSMWLNRKSS